MHTPLRSSHGKCHWGETRQGRAEMLFLSPGEQNTHKLWIKRWVFKAQGSRTCAASCLSAYMGPAGLYPAPYSLRPSPSPSNLMSLQKRGIDSARLVTGNKLSFRQLYNFEVWPLRKAPVQVWKLDRPTKNVVGHGCVQQWLSSLPSLFLVFFLEKLLHLLRVPGIWY